MRCAWVDGSAVTGGFDEWSDLDLTVLCTPGTSTGVYTRWLARAREDFDVRDVRELPVSTWPDGRQAFVNLQDRPGLLLEPVRLVDLHISDVGDEHTHVDVRRHGSPMVLHDPDGLLLLEHEDVSSAMDEAISQVRQRRVTGEWLVNRAIARGHVAEAVDFYLRFALAGVVRLARVEHCPWRHDFGLRYLRDDLPPEVADQIEELVPEPPPPHSRSSRCAATRGSTSSSPTHQEPSAWRLRCPRLPSHALTHGFPDRPRPGIGRHAGAEPGQRRGHGVRERVHGVQRHPRHDVHRDRIGGRTAGGGPGQRCDHQGQVLRARRRARAPDGPQDRAGHGGREPVPIVAQSPSINVPNTLSTQDVRLPVTAGDFLGLSGSAGTLYCNTPSAGDKAVAFAGDAALGSTETYTSPNANLSIPVIATIEPDADGDGYGDITQDLCQRSAAVQVACPVVELDSLALRPGNDRGRRGVVQLGEGDRHRPREGQRQEGQAQGRQQERRPRLPDLVQGQAARGTEERPREAASRARRSPDPDLLCHRPGWGVTTDKTKVKLPGTKH